MPDRPLRVGMHGATGRMGARIIQLIREDSSLALSAAIDRPGHPNLGQDVGPLIGLGPIGVSLTAGLDAPLDVLIDFSSPDGTLGLVDSCVRHKVPLVVGTTGFEPDGRRRVEDASAAIPVLISANFSKGVNLLFRLARVAAEALKGQADVEIIERHHHFKKDAPSGTALKIAEVVGDVLQVGPGDYAHGREGVVGERPRGEIGLHALRTGDNPGEHTVVFGLMGECLELSHRALNRDGFARGAIDAARFLAGQPAGRYTMDDLLGH